jgi:molybdopterin-binding protein
MSADTQASGRSSAPPLVVGEGLKVAYRGRTVVDVPRVEFPSGATYALLGASGAGKSTLLRLIGLLERPQAGHVTFDGSVIRPGDLSGRRRIAAVFQKPYLLHGTVGDNVAYGLRLRGVSRVDRASRVTTALETVGLAGWEGHSALTLSGGEAQRVALARALVLEPSLLLLDEPLSFLDPLLKRELTAEFADILTSRHVTVVYVTHDQDEAAVVADRIGVMREGRIVTEGTPDEVLGLPSDEWVASFIGMEPALEGRVTANEDGLATIEVGGTPLYAASGLPVGTSVHLAVRPEDVTIYEAGAELPLGSARNRLDAVVAELRPGGGTVHVVLDHRGTRIAAAVSRASASELSLESGTRVVAVFKATAVRVRRVES